jgi:hypothetical protein
MTFSKFIIKPKCWVHLRCRYFYKVMIEMQYLFSAPIVARCRAQANSGRADDAKLWACAAHKKN